MKQLGTVRLESDRLVLRAFRESDAKALYENWGNDAEVTKFLTWPTHKSVEVSERVLKSWIESYQDPKSYQWAIVLKENGDEPIGSISVVEIDEQTEKVQVGYCIGRKWWHKGIMSEAFSRLIQFFFEECGVNRVEARHDTKNPNSGKVMLKCGLQYEGTMRKGDHNNQGICDVSFYGILADDYQKKKDSVSLN